MQPGKHAVCPKNTGSKNSKLHASQESCKELKPHGVVISAACTQLKMATLGPADGIHLDPHTHPHKTLRQQAQPISAPSDDRLFPNQRLVRPQHEALTPFLPHMSTSGSFPDAHSPSSVHSPVAVACAAACTQAPPRSSCPLLHVRIAPAPGPCMGHHGSAHLSSDPTGSSGCGRCHAGNCELHPHPPASEMVRCGPFAAGRPGCASPWQVSRQRSAAQFPVHAAWTLSLARDRALCAACTPQLSARSGGRA